MRLYVANPTRQNHVFMYRTMEDAAAPGVGGKLSQQPIPHGQQVPIAGEMSREEIDFIVKQHARYGMIGVDELARTKTKVSLIYSVDKPVKADGITYIFDKNIGILSDEGRERRREAAIVANNLVDNVARDAGRPEVGQFDVTLQEDRPEGSVNEVAQLSEGLQIRKDPAGSRGRR